LADGDVAEEEESRRDGDDIGEAIMDFFAAMVRSCAWG
jgi:hypothetical protein